MELSGALWASSRDGVKRAAAVETEAALRRSVRRLRLWGMVYVVFQEMAGSIHGSGCVLSVKQRAVPGGFRSVPWTRFYAEEDDC